MLEYREWNGVRMTYIAGKKEPVWLVAFLLRKLGHIPRVARRLRWNRQLVRIAWEHAEWNPDQMRREEEEATQCGFRSEYLMDSPHALVVPGSTLRGKTPQRRFRRCRYCR